MKELIKKVLAHRQAKQELVRKLMRQAHINEQVKLILQGLEERGY